MTVEASVEVSHSDQDLAGLQSGRLYSDFLQNGKPTRIDPDLDFIRSLNLRSRGALKKCMQCGTCSATCALSPVSFPFPRKEMAWAAWGMKDRLLGDPDIWLCHQCNDCSTRCPRNARPGDILAILRQESIIHHAFPRFFGRWAGQPHCIPLLLGIPTALLTLALLLKDSIQSSLGLQNPVGERIVYSYSSVFPRWLINGFFLTFSGLAILLFLGGILSLWRAMRGACGGDAPAAPAKGFLASVLTALRAVVKHERFADCTRAQTRYWTHLCVFFGFAALSMVALWVITAPYNPLIRESFVYPFSFLNPWKILANTGGVAVLAGSLWMIWERMKDSEDQAAGFFDWAFIATLLAVVLTGFATEVLHYVRLEPHRHLVYFTHLVWAAALLLYLPYSKFAHAVYRTTALVCAEYYGRAGDGEREPAPRTRLEQE